MDFATMTFSGLGALVGAAAGSYFKGYGEQKGKNLATHEDITLLVDQVRAVTQTTKEIEARISDDVWDRQKRWELRKELILVAVAKAHAMFDALSSLQAIQLTEHNSRRQGLPARTEVVTEKAQRWTVSVQEFTSARVALELVCDEDAIHAAKVYSLLLGQIVSPVLNGDINIFQEKLETMVKAGAALNSALRDQLGSPSSQSRK